MVAILFVAAELALILRAPVPSIVPWSVVAVVGTTTVASFAVIADHFPPELAGRANGALNLLHFGWAFLAQFGTGLILEQWSVNGGHRPVQAYQIAFSLNVAIQIAALLWFALPPGRDLASQTRPIPSLVPADVFDDVESISSYEDWVILPPSEDDVAW
ncbi:hypothetical protein GCM10010987_74350 [Bradyrhizobium guangdongense]|nr:hypothetical protein GCM10010987_74350 [Bradyrhizobium guangdongense]